MSSREADRCPSDEENEPPGEENPDEIMNPDCKSEPADVSWSTCDKNNEETEHFELPVVQDPYVDISSDSEPYDVSSSRRYRSQDEIINPHSKSQPENASLPTCSEDGNEENNLSPRTIRTCRVTSGA